MIVTRIVKEKKRKRCRIREGTGGAQLMLINLVHNSVKLWKLEFIGASNASRTKVLPIRIMSEERIKQRHFVQAYILSKATNKHQT
jgi:hypothetical protein